MRKTSDVVIVGLGAMGAAAAYELGKRNARVIALEQFDIGHAYGSSHGESRIIRQACFEHPSYAPLSLRAYALLAELNRRSGQDHFIICGGLMIGSRESAPVAGSLATARRHGLPYELLEAKEVRRRFPMLRLADGQVAFFEAKAGVAFPEKLLRSWTGAAKHSGVELYQRCAVTAVEPHDNGVRVCGDGFAVEAGQAIVAAGPWLDRLFPELRPHLSVERIVQHWFTPQDVRPFLPNAFPIFYWDVGPYQLYGFPCMDPGSGSVKVGLDNDRTRCRPESVDRTVTKREITDLDRALASHIPALHDRYLRSEPCLWTVSPDCNFIIGRHPGCERIILAGGCSGRAFKFAPVIGEILADLALAGATAHDISLFSPQRLPAVEKQIPASIYA